MLNFKNHLPMIVIHIFTPGFVYTVDGMNSSKLVPLVICGHCEVLLLKKKYAKNGNNSKFCLERVYSLSKKVLVGKVLIVQPIAHHFW